MNRNRVVGILGLLAVVSATGFGAEAVAQLSPRARPNFGTIALRPGFVPDPRTVHVVSGGRLAAQTVANAACRGFVSANPDVVLNLSGTSSFFRVYVNSQSDTTLVVRRPDGNFLCNDDTYGTNPSVEGTFAAGRYQVWVGSYTAGENAQADLSFTELQSNHP